MIRQVVTTNPNFTIVLPTSCNADCSFCSWRTSNQHKQKNDTDVFIKSLVYTLENLPDSCTQITISGGEPSTFKDLDRVMGIIAYHKHKNIQKVVFTTNGEKLSELSKRKWFTDVVDFVNISRHHFDQEANNKIFGILTINWSDIKTIAEILSIKGIATNVNCVLSESLNKNYKRDFVDYFVDECRENYINSITFRSDYDDGGEVHYLESHMGEKVGISECDVCRKSEYLIKGTKVMFTNSEFEPTEVLGEDSIYEFILQPNGNLTSDWEGNLDITLINDNAAMFEESLKVIPLTKKTMRTNCGGGPSKPAPSPTQVSCGAGMSSCG